MIGQKLCKFLVFWSLLTLIFLFDNNLLHAADLHVGSNYAYRSISDAISASKASDRVVIHQGTYNEFYLIPNSNTTLIAANRAGVGADNEAMPIIDAQQRSYHTSDNYDIIVFYPYRKNVTLEGLHFKNGGRDCVFLSDSGASNITIQYCEFTMNAWSSYAQDNSACIYIEPSNSNSGTIQFNKITSAIAGVHGIIGFAGGGDWKIRNNEIFISGNGGGGKDSHGIFWKHGGIGANQMIIQNNAIKTTGSSANGGIWIVNDNTVIDNNLIYGGNIRYALTIGGSMGVTGGDNCVVTHNTVYGGNWSGVFMEDNYYAKNNVWRDNVIIKLSSGTEYGVLSFWVYGSGSHSVTSDYNCLYQSNTSIVVKRYRDSYSLNNWAALGYGKNSVRELPGFANRSGNMNEIRDFEIISGNSNNGASDGTDMGADIRSVGLLATPNQNKSEIDSVQNLRVVGAQP